VAEGTTRIGVAIDIPEPWGSALTRRRDAAGDPQAAYTPAHVTLLGPTEILTEALPSFRPITEVVFVTLAVGISECELLAAAITASEAINRDTRFPYHPHVTVAQDVPSDALDAVFEDLADFSARFHVGGFTLFSHGGEGPWQRRREYPLGGLR
jgi:2'-5' RNA ligase